MSLGAIKTKITTKVVDIIHENDLDSFFADTQYIKDDNKIYF